MSSSKMVGLYIGHVHLHSPVIGKKICGGAVLIEITGTFQQVMNQLESMEPSLKEWDGETFSVTMLERELHWVSMSYGGAKLVKSELEDRASLK